MGLMKGGKDYKHSAKQFINVRSKLMEYSVVKSNMLGFNLNPEFCDFRYVERLCQTLLARESQEPLSIHDSCFF